MVLMHDAPVTDVTGALWSDSYTAIEGTTDGICAWYLLVVECV